MCEFLLIIFFPFTIHFQSASSNNYVKTELFGGKDRSHCNLVIICSQKQGSTNIYGNYMN